MFEVVVIVLLVLAILVGTAVLVVGAYVYWMMLGLPLLWIARDALRWTYHRYFVPTADYYEELRREIRNRKP